MNQIFFYHNDTISVDAVDFWEKSYLIRTAHRKAGDLIGTDSASKRASLSLSDIPTCGVQSISSHNLDKGKEHNIRDLEVCPLFLKEMAQAIISAGKSLQLIRHISSGMPLRNEMDNDRMDVSGHINRTLFMEMENRNFSIAGLTLAEVFVVSLVALVSQGDHISGNRLCGKKIMPSTEYQKPTNENGTEIPVSTFPEKIWSKLLIEGISPEVENKTDLKCNGTLSTPCKDKQAEEYLPSPSFCAENPVITVCQNLLLKDGHDLSKMNISRNLFLPPLDDEGLRDAIFDGRFGSSIGSKRTNYAFGFGFTDYEYSRKQSDLLVLEGLFPFPTILPPFKVTYQTKTWIFFLCWGANFET